MSKRNLMSLSLLATTALASVSSQADENIWPEIRKTIPVDAKIETRIDELLAKMSIEQKVGQMIQPEIKNISPEDVAKYHIGSVLNGGGSWPTNEVDGPLAGWLSMASLFHGASMDTNDNRLAIPIMWGTDAVHGHNNVQGATIFPHNIGLGAANNPGLMRDIGTITAREVAVTGIDWAFSPTVAVARDMRWGRSYESFSSNPEIVAELSKEYVLGIQGHPALDNFLSQQKIIATAKHFIGDGGTTEGDDQGNTEISEEELFRIHGQGYVQTIGAGVQTVMASFNSWNGEKLHGHKYMLTDVLKGRMGFDGFVLGDWNGHEQVEGCTAASCPQSINAGVDMIMVPEMWKEFLNNTVSQVKGGEISQARIDDAVRRILRVKLRAGMFEDGKPSLHELAGRAKLIGHKTHRAVARQAVRESLVLLKNDNVLPIKTDKNILVAGIAADHAAYQNGGWTLTWQGRDIETKIINPPEIYKGHTTIFDGFEQAGANVSYSENGTFDESNRPDVAIIVMGEEPYAEFEGDLLSLDFDLENSKEFALIKSLKAQNIPVVTVFLSGRPLGIDPLLELSDGLVAAWLPGSEGAGVSDVLMAGSNGQPQYDFKGRLSFAWPAMGDATQFNHGYGLTYTGRSVIK
ncbi:MAG: glycoside hydrolase family 3 protein [Maricaulaceae bacterium]